MNLQPAPYLNILPPCHPFLEAAMQFSEAMQEAAKGLKAFAEAMAAIKDFDIPSITATQYRRLESEIAYALAGHPYGKNHKGRKRWMKRINNANRT